MSLKDVILGRFAWNRARREKALQSLAGLSLDERRQAVHALVVGSVAPRIVRLRGKAGVLAIEAGNGQILKVEQRDASGVLYRFDCAARPAATVNEVERGALLARFVDFLRAGDGGVAVELEPLAEERTGHQGLSPEIMIADEAQFPHSDTPVQILTGEDDELGPMAEFDVDDLPDAAPVDVAEPAAPDPADADVRPADAADGVDASPEPQAAPERQAEPEVAEPVEEAMPQPAAAAAGVPGLLNGFAARLVGDVLECALRSEVATDEVEPARGLERFRAAVSPHIGETMLVIYLSDSENVESLATAVDSNDAIAIRFHRARFGKLIYEWLAASVKFR